MEIRFFKQRPKSLNATIEISFIAFLGMSVVKSVRVPAAQSFVQNLYFASKIENPLKTTLLSGIPHITPVYWTLFNKAKMKGSVENKATKAN
jgi:hypothetical protein